MNARIAELKEERAKLVAENDELRKQCDKIYEDYKKEMDEAHKQAIAQRAQRENRDKMKPTLEKLYDMNVYVHEEPRWSGHFQISARFNEADSHAQAKAGLIAALQRQLQEKKAEEVQKKELSKEEMKRLRQQKNKKFVTCLDMDISMWMSELNVKQEDIDTPEKKQATIDRLLSNDDSEKETQKKEFMDKVNALVEELKQLGAEVEMKE